MKQVILILGVCMVVVTEARHILEPTSELADGAVNNANENNLKYNSANRKRHRRQFQGSRYSCSCHDEIASLNAKNEVIFKELQLLKNMVEKLLSRDDQPIIQNRSNENDSTLIKPSEEHGSFQTGDDGKRQISFKPVQLKRPISNQPPVEHGTIQAGDNDGSDGKRRISFNPVQLRRPISNQPPVEHGTVQAGDNDGSDGRRPISFEPVQPNRFISNQPTVEHGTVQLTNATKPPTRCEVTILFCCDKKGLARKNCFESENCLLTYNTGVACHPQVVNAVINKFVATYTTDVA